MHTDYMIPYAQGPFIHAWTHESVRCSTRASLQVGLPHAPGHILLSRGNNVLRQPVRAPGALAASPSQLGSFFFRPDTFVLPPSSTSQASEPYQRLLSPSAI